MARRNNQMICGKRNVVLVIVGFVALVMTAATHSHLSADDVVPSKLIRAAAPQVISTSFDRFSFPPRVTRRNH